MTEPQAFLSYTRIDDEFFGGAITSLRKSLELAVRVVTGDRNFCIFQDIEGIEFGQQWQRRLDRAIEKSTFFIPILTPCFFQSDPCRDELEKFLKHEKMLGRDDLILPIYYVTIPTFEGRDPSKPDRIADEVSNRQRYDWRQKANLAVDGHEIRKSVQDLAEKMASAIARSSKRINNTGEERQRSPGLLDRSTEPLARKKQPRKTEGRTSILWVDDRPDNNIFERQSFNEYNIEFVLARSTQEALGKLIGQKFDAIISDMGRPPDLQAGYTLLDVLRSSGNKTPFFIYAGSRTHEHVKEARHRGAQGTTNMPSELISMVLKELSTACGSIS